MVGGGERVQKGMDKRHSFWPSNIHLPMPKTSNTLADCCWIKMTTGNNWCPISGKIGRNGGGCHKSWSDREQMQKCQVCYISWW